MQEHNVPANAIKAARAVFVRFILRVFSVVYQFQYLSGVFGKGRGTVCEEEVAVAESP